MSKSPTNPNNITATKYPTHTGIAMKMKPSIFNTRAQKCNICNKFIADGDDVFWYKSTKSFSHKDC